MKVDTLADLVKAAKAQPGKLNWAATPGLPYYVLLALQKSAGIEMVQVAYRDFAPAYQDLNQGRLHVAGTGVPTLVPHHRAGTAKLLFVTNRERSPQAPDVPTARGGGISRPRPSTASPASTAGATCRPRSRRASPTDMRAIIADPAFRARVIGVGTAPRIGTPEEFAAAIEEQRARSRPSIKPATRSPRSERCAGQTYPLASPIQRCRPRERACEEIPLETATLQNPSVQNQNRTVNLVLFLHTLESWDLVITGLSMWHGHVMAPPPRRWLLGPR